MVRRERALRNSERRGNRMHRSIPIVLAGLAVLLAGCRTTEVALRENKLETALAGAASGDVAYLYLCAADDLRDIGSSKAQDYYRKAIEAAPDDPWYRFAYAEYLRQYRGPGQPLFPVAANEYFEALSQFISDSVNR